MRTLKTKHGKEEKKVTKEEMLSLFLDERAGWRQEVGDKLWEYIHRDIEHPDGVDGCLLPVKLKLVEEISEETGGVKIYPVERDLDKATRDRVEGKVIMETFRQRSPTEAKGVLAHEFAEIDFELMSVKEKQQVNRIFSIIYRGLELVFFQSELYGVSEREVNLYLAKDTRQNYCFWMVALRHESKERLAVLKKINKKKFNFCKKRIRADKRKRLIEKLREGVHSLY